MSVRTYFRGIIVTKIFLSTNANQAISSSMQFTTPPGLRLGLGSGIKFGSDLHG